jgi:hypothetical protein
MLQFKVLRFIMYKYKKNARKIQAFLKKIETQII